MRPWPDTTTSKVYWLPNSVSLSSGNCEMASVVGSAVSSAKCIIIQHAASFTEEGFLRLRWVVEENELISCLVSGTPSKNDRNGLKLYTKPWKCRNATKELEGKLGFDFQRCRFVICCNISRRIPSALDEDYVISGNVAVLRITSKNKITHMWNMETTWTHSWRFQACKTWKQHGPTLEGFRLCPLK